MHIDFAINVIQKSKKYICIYEIVRVLYGKTIDVILTAENQSYVRIKKRTVNAPCSSWTHKNTFGVIRTVNLLTSLLSSSYPPGTYT